MDNLVGQRVGPYRLVARVRSDGVTTVYKVHEPSIDRAVALTILSTSLVQQDAFNERLQRAARTLSRLQHAHTVPFYDHGQFEGRPYLVTGYVEGQTLRERLRARRSGRPLPLPEALRIIGQIGAALDDAHQLGIVHGDVRPGNVLLDAEGGAFLIGFGLADLVPGSGAPGWLGVGLGAPVYMSPEQVAARPADARSDVYSLGVMLYRMTAGRLPHQAGTPLGTALQQLDELPPLPRALQPDLPEDVEQVIQRAMAAEPDHRFPTAGEMVAALDEAVNGTQPIRRRAPLLAKAPWEGRERGNWVPTPAWSVLGPVLGGVVLLLLILLLARLPVHVQLEGGQVEVVRVIDQTATPLPAARATTSTPTPSPAATLPFVTATPVVFPTNTPLPPAVDPEVGTFAEPILAAIADREPDFSDDFEPGDSGWTWDTVDAGAAQLDYGVEDGVARVELTDGATVSLHHPQLKATDFVLRVESRQAGGASGSEQQVFLHFADAYFNVTLVSGSRYWWSGVSWFPNGSIDGEGAVVRPMGETNETTLVVQGEQLAVYLNDVPVLYLEEPILNATHWISLWCHGVPDAACEFDNVRLWELEE